MVEQRPLKPRVSGSSPLSAAILAAIFIAFYSFLFWAVFVHGPSVSAEEQRELRFYQTEPSCADKKIGYVIVRGSYAMTEHHRVWICGLDYKK